jgi:YegS/Rv2252/BmrU family lipid kinase
MKKRILVLINPKSGTGKQNKAINALNKTIDFQLFETEIIYSQFKGHMSVLAKNAAENNYDAVVVVGGDGSINEAAQGLIGTKTALGIIPIGSGNGLARHLKIPLQIKSAIEKINAFKTEQIDTARINNHQFVSLAGIGFDAHIAKQFDISGKRGLWNYTKISVREFFRFSSQKYYLSIDEKDYEEEAFMVVFANANQFGNNFVISPQGKINDGLLDVCIVRKPKIYQVPDLFLKLFLKRIHHADLIKIVRAKNINVRLKHSNLINLDGESVVIDGDLTLAINPLSLHIIC